MKKWHYSKVIYRAKKTFMGALGFSRSVNHLHNLRSIDIGLLKSGRYGKDIERFCHKLKITEQVSDYVNIQKLLAKKNQLVVIDPAVAVYMLDHFFSKTQKQQLKFIPSPYFKPISFYLVCAKHYGNYLNYIKKFNLGMADLVQGGTQTALLKQAGNL
jgi:ABC-type amino acid transport substrate-binding protein